MKHLVGKIVNVKSTLADAVVTTVRVDGISEVETEYPIICTILQEFKIEGFNFAQGEDISFNDQGLWRGKAHTDSKEFDMFLELPSKDSKTVEILMVDYEEQVMKVAEDVDMAAELLVPHLKSGRLSLETFEKIVKDKL